MNLELVEALCLKYLQQVENPLAPLDKLLQYCRRDDQCKQLQEKELIDFLRGHELFEVIEGPSEDAPVDMNLFSSAGIELGCRVILKTRIPAPNELFSMLNQQVNIMKSTLAEAIEEARKTGDENSIKQLETAIERAATLESKINRLP